MVWRYHEPDLPYSADDIALLRRIARHDGPFYATAGRERKRCRRLRRLRVLQGGRLGHHYFELTHDGRSLLVKIDGRGAA